MPLLVLWRFKLQGEAEKRLGGFGSEGPDLRDHFVGEFFELVIVVGRDLDQAFAQPTKNVSKTEPKSLVDTHIQRQRDDSLLDNRLNLGDGRTLDEINHLKKVGELVVRWSFHCFR